MTKLTKVGSSGPRFSVYGFSTTNLTGDSVGYTSTFIGSQSVVIAAITKESEATSIIAFDVTVPDAGVWFGAAYATDWTGDRLLTMAITGTSDNIDNINDLPDNVKSAFIYWNGKIDWRASDIFEEFKTQFINRVNDQSST